MTHDGHFEITAKTGIDSVIIRLFTNKETTDLSVSILMILLDSNRILKKFINLTTFIQNGGRTRKPNLKKTSHSLISLLNI